jgi:hypothetical protein
MAKEVKLSRLRGLIDALDYPLSNEEAREELAGVRLLYADGDEPATAVIARSNEDTFEDAADLEAEIYGNLPIDAVGEPGQSEGEG